MQQIRFWCWCEGDFFMYTGRPLLTPIEHVYMLHIVWIMDCIQQGWFFRNPLLYQMHLGAANSHYELCKFAFFPSVSPSNEGLFSSCFDSFVFDRMYLGAANSYCELCEFAFFCHPLRLQMRVLMAVVFGLFLLTKCVWAQRIHIANFVSVPFFPPIRFAFKWGSLCRLFLVCFLWPNPFGRREFLLRILWVFLLFVSSPVPSLVSP